MHSVNSPNQGTNRESLVKVPPQIRVLHVAYAHTCDLCLRHERLKAVRQQQPATYFVDFA